MLSTGWDLLSSVGFTLRFSLHWIPTPNPMKGCLAFSMVPGKNLDHT